MSPLVTAFLQVCLCFAAGAATILIVLGCISFAADIVRGCKEGRSRG